MTSADTLEEVQFLTSCGESPTTIARRLGISASGVAKALERAGRPDLARPYWSLAQQDRARGRTCDCGAPIRTVNATRCVTCGHHQRMLTRYGANA